MNVIHSAPTYLDKILQFSLAWYHNGGSNQRCSNSLNTVIGRRDNRTYFARQGSSAHGPHMRQASSEQDALQDHRLRKQRPNTLGTPAFSRPAQLQPDIPSAKGIQSAEAPRFARPNGKHGQPEFHSEEKTSNFASKGSEWSPRMDVLESGLNYVVTLEIPVSV
ncbi:UNVERIFIED_CONTAM: hypothetical protein Slati_2101600 [Sesamum latifolium]|uniref:Uncharacterized protein n=1 Tax=Sesamum latifolium TaxID=2727402 RepID=A0AAW2WS44_9LAMI